VRPHDHRVPRGAVAVEGCHAEAKVAVAAQEGAPTHLPREHLGQRGLHLGHSSGITRREARVDHGEAARERAF
jgi:hypothetical protein